MSLVTPHTWAVNETVTQTNLTTLGDATLQLQGGAPSAGAIDFCVMRATAVQALAVSTWTSLALDAEDVDRANGHSTTTNNSRYTAVLAGWYQVLGGCSFAANASITTIRAVRFLVNGVTVVYGSQNDCFPTTAANNADAQTSCFVFLNAGDYIELQAFSAVALNTSVTTPGGVRMHLRWLST